MEKSKYTPKVHTQIGIINCIDFKMNRNKYTISNIDELDVIDSNIYVEQDKIKGYNDANRLIYTWLIDKNNISYTNEDIISFEENSKIGIRGGYFEKFDNQTYNAIDFNKAYTSNLYDMDMIPVYQDLIYF